MWKNVDFSYQNKYLTPDWYLWGEEIKPTPNFLIGIDVDVILQHMPLI